MNLHYSNYLQLDKILSAQELESTKVGKTAHDEHLFIVVHQVYELWFKQILFELESVRTLFEKKPLPESDLIVLLSRLDRCNTLWPILKEQIKVMETMTPMDFLEFRHLLYPASGFQSLQFRVLETLLGLKEQNRSPQEREFFTSRLNVDEKKALAAAAQKNDLKTLLDQWLSRMPFLTDATDAYWNTYQQQVHRHFSDEAAIIQKNNFLTEESKNIQLKTLNEQVVIFKKIFDPKEYSELLKQSVVSFSQKGLLCALFILLHRNEPLLQIPFKIIQAFINFDSELTSWRHSHAILAQKMLGKKIGTGGSSGADYLMQMAIKHRLFSDLMNLSNYLLPSSYIPPLDPAIKEKMQFKY